MTTAIVKAQPVGLTSGVRIEGMNDVWQLAEGLSRADGFVPRAFLGKPAAVAAAILTGIELGLGPMESLRSLHIVEGKPTMSAELMLARARKAGVRTRWLRTDEQVATLQVTVPGEAPQELSYTIEEAQRANLVGKGNWRTYPAAMLRARATSAAIRAFCPEALGASGVYESDSGEITDGVPADAVPVHVAAEVAAPTRTRPGSEERLRRYEQQRQEQAASPAPSPVDALLERMATAGPDDVSGILSDVQSSPAVKANQAVRAAYAAMVQRLRAEQQREAG